MKYIINEIHMVPGNVLGPEAATLLIENQQQERTSTAEPSKHPLGRQACVVPLHVRH